MSGSSSVSGWFCWLASQENFTQLIFNDTSPCIPTFSCCNLQSQSVFILLEAVPRHLDTGQLSLPKFVGQLRKGATLLTHVGKGRMATRLLRVQPRSRVGV